MHFTLLAVCSFVTAVIAAPAVPADQRRHVVHERRDVLPAGWERTSTLHPRSYFPMRIALTQSNLHRADEILMDVSDPMSSNFGKHWTVEEIAEFFAPSQETYESVALWLTESGIHDFKQSSSRGWITANVTVVQAERLLKTKYYSYEHSTGVSHVACEQYMVPEDLQERIDIITPTIHFAVKVHDKEKRDRAAVVDIASPDINIASPSVGEAIPLANSFEADADNLANCDTVITPDCLRALYKIPTNIPANPKSE